LNQTKNALRMSRQEIFGQNYTSFVISPESTYIMIELKTAFLYTQSLFSDYFDSSTVLCFLLLTSLFVFTQWKKT
jgi:hypothetical protein